MSGDIGYVRFHSRNGVKWYGSAAERYDYNYAEAKLLEWVPMLQQIAKRARRLFIFFNNCHLGQAASNAQAMMKIVKQMTLW